MDLRRLRVGGVVVPIHAEAKRLFFVELDRRWPTLGAASLATLRRRVTYGGRKGRSAARRLKTEATWEKVGGLFDGMATAFADAMVPIYENMSRIQEQTRLLSIRDHLDAVEGRIGEFRRYGLLATSRELAHARLVEVIPVVKAPAPPSAAGP